jgi:uncharacterized protein (TIGR02453 family)
MKNTFCSESLQFLTENRINNSRDWCRENKKTYEEFLLNPFQRLVTELSPAMLAIDTEMETTPVIGKTISRLSRDTRFSRDSSLYRDSMWITFVRRTKERNDYPAFFFEIHPDSYRYGMGFFHASVQSMNHYRDAILRREAEFVRLITEIKNDGIFVPEGEKYKKSHYPGLEEVVATWYDRKNIYLTAKRENIREIFDFDSLKERLFSGFTCISGFYLFLKSTMKA